ncbi:MlaD family protein [Methyloceanibacter sp. wino2]|uniref:MlaD family protein n=1 Tax=Methyloceanibacter sp. wino2 TaxID=2170729 RepID=UPI000D3E7803|nr:MlaD family protein [Methyloceanibacter sp. wino2]
METRANYLMIGGFILGALALIFIFVFWVANIAGGGNRYQIVFDSSVAGLTTGSRVGFNGIKVGEVQSFALDPQDARKVRVVISVSDNTPIREDSLATIKSMGLAGGSGVEISPGSPDSPLLVATDEHPIPTIEAAPMAGAGIFDAAPAALNTANAFIKRLDALIAANEQEINNTMKNVDEFTSMLEGKNQEIEQAIVDLRSGAEDFKQISAKLDKNLDELTLEAKKGMQDFSAAMQQARQTAATMDRVLKKFEANPASFLFGGSRQGNVQRR